VPLCGSVQVVTSVSLRRKFGSSVSLVQMIVCTMFYIRSASLKTLKRENGSAAAPLLIILFFYASDQIM
jgi:hypothetical protein